MLVEIWSDVVCPWCAIGRARFARALERFEAGDEVTVRYRSFELDPDAPRELPGTHAEQLAAKFGRGVDEAQAMVDHVTSVAAADGLDFRLDRARAGNTFDAHRLLHLAADHGRQAVVLDRFLTGYFAEGEVIGDPATLRRLAVEAGLPEADVDRVLAGDGYAQAVRADEAQARAYGISGVPFFVLDGRYGISGAQPVEALLGGLRQAWSERGPLTPVGAHGGHVHDDGCVDGSCAV